MGERITRRQLLERRKSEGKLPADFNIDAVLKPGQPQPPRQAEVNPAGGNGSPMAAAQPFPPRSGPSLPTGHSAEVLRALANRIASVSDAGMAELAKAVSLMAERIETADAEVSGVQTRLTMLEATLAMALSRLEEAEKTAQRTAASLETTGPTGGREIPIETEQLLDLSRVEGEDVASAAMPDTFAPFPVVPPTEHPS